MNKTLVNSYDEFVSFVDEHTGIIAGHGRVKSDFWISPEKYPCIVVWSIRYDENGPDKLYGEFVYVSDFESFKIE